MAQDQRPQAKFDVEIKLEAERLLRDEIFKRAPIQSRLLRFLVDHTLTSSVAPTQYQVAVDGLGKPDDYDLESDSYPRVQISRLRKSIDAYYSRNLAGNGYELRIDRNSYRLILEAGKAPVTNVSSANLVLKFLEWFRKFSPRKASLMGLSVIGVISALLLIMSVAPSSGRSVSEKPTTRLVIENGIDGSLNSLDQDIVDIVVRVSKIQLRNSFVSKPTPPGEDGKAPDYSLVVHFGVREGNSTPIFISLADEDGDVIYLNEIAANPDEPEKLASQIEASLVYLTSPTGTIARAELPSDENTTSSDYACFLAIENRRSNGSATAHLVDDCIRMYPDSEYRSFWHARRAFYSFQRDIASGRSVERSGVGWMDLRSALLADRHNAFANFTAAKVELANDDCEGAQIYIKRALIRGGSYPGLVAAVEANAASCSVNPAEGKAMADRLRSLARYNPDPDPLLHLYLMIGLVASGDRATAETVANRAPIQNPEGMVEETSDLLRRSLSDTQFAQSKKTQLSEAIYFFVWNKETADSIVDAIAD